MYGESPYANSLPGYNNKQKAANSLYRLLTAYKHLLRPTYLLTYLIKPSVRRRTTTVHLKFGFFVLGFSSYFNFAVGPRLS